MLAIVDLNRPHEVILASLDNYLSQRISLDMSLQGVIRALIHTKPGNHAKIELLFCKWENERHGDKLSQLQIEL